MNIVKSKSKKIISILIMLIGIMFILAGCSVPRDTVNELTGALTERIRQNISIAQSLMESGILSEADYKIITKSIEQNQDLMQSGLFGNISDPNEVNDELQGVDKIIGNATYTYGNSKQSMSTIKNLMKAIVDWRVISYPANETMSKEEWDSQFFTNYMIHDILDTGWFNENTSDIAKKNVGIAEEGRTIKPLVILNQDVVDNINEKFGYPIYVLNTNFENQSLDEIITEVKSGSEKQDESILNKYFHKLTYTDENGTERDVTFLDTSQPENQLIRVTTGSKYATEDYMATSKKDLTDESETGPMLSVSKQLGHDMVVTSAGYEIMAIRLVEFNQEAVDKIINTLGLSEDKYLICNNKIYVMEYPVGYISGFTENEDRTEYEAIIERSQLSINIKTGNLYKSEITADGEIAASSTKISTDDPYILMGGSEGESNNVSSFMVDGETGISTPGTEDDPNSKPWNLTFGGIQLPGKSEIGVEASVGRIVLCDYLEATFAPDVVENDSLIVLGRKLRIVNIKGNKNMEVARVYDKGGQELLNNAEQPIRFYINDFADIDMLGLYREQEMQENKNEAMKDIRAIREMIQELRMIENNEELTATDRGASQAAIQASLLQKYPEIGREMQQESDGSISIIEAAEQVVRQRQEIVNQEVERSVAYISLNQEELYDESQNQDNNNTGMDTGDAVPTGSILDVENTSNDTTTDDVESEISNIDSLGKLNSIFEINSIKKRVVSEIKCTTTFPGELIGMSDYNISDDKPLFYAMLVNTDIFQTGLFSGWINNKDESKNSTGWWNIWLIQHGYNYRINTDNLVNFLKGNYMLELNKEGIFVLNLETVAKITEEYNQQAKAETAQWLKTVFVLFGYALIMYSLILLIAWNTDVNVNLGLNMLEKISFGRWVAIKDMDELPCMNTEETNYINFSRLIISCIGITSVGIAFILVDITTVILLLIKLFGGLASYIVKLVTGV